MSERRGSEGWLTAEEFSVVSGQFSVGEEIKFVADFCRFSEFAV
jgi:hypothetical protein